MSILEKIQPEFIDYTEVDNELDYQKAVNIEVSKTLKHKQKAQMDDIRDDKNYCVFVFCNRTDKDNFLKTIKDTEIIGETFVDGYEYAKSIGIDIKMTASLPDPHYIKQQKKKFHVKAKKIKI